MQGQDLKEDDRLEIEPIAFRSGRRKRSKPYFPVRWLVAVAAAFILILLSVSVWFVFTAKRVFIHIDPKPDRIEIEGSLISLRLSGYYLLRPGEYSLRAVKQCYHRLEEPFQVQDQARQEIRFTMEALPGRFSLMVKLPVQRSEAFPEGKAWQTKSESINRPDQPSLEVKSARVFIDGKDLGASPITEMEMDSGQRHLQILAEDYQGLETDVVIRGCGEHQTFDFALVPGWSDIFISSVPESADVSIDGDPAGKTPLTIQLLAGTYHLEIGTTGFKSWEKALTVHANQPQKLTDILLEPADGVLVLRTNPSGANVTVGNAYMGQTPLNVPLPKDVKHVIRISKSGYEPVSRTVQVPAAKSKKMTVNLKARKGVIHFAVDPPDAKLVVDGKVKGPVPEKMTLIAMEHQLEIRKKGYQTYRTKIVPRPGFPQEITITLKKRGSKTSERPEEMQAKNGYSLKLIRPAPFTMGSSRREQGRRSNETLRHIQLQRPFYMGTREVTNREFKEFLANHRSGAFKGHRLGRDELPVVQVTWQEAAMFCNWLSAKESLPPAYIQKGEGWVAAAPMGTGYRLPTEAEWEYCARFKDNQAALKYPWGKRFPPTSPTGNYADVSAKALLSVYLEDYHDGYTVTAPPAKFRPNDLGLYDFGGNVSEWCHDYYSTYAYDDNKVTVDPSGPQQGKHHVVRGSSWKHASISTLRLSYRDYSNDKRPDLGFRICRYEK
jgi:formylglycine-generating enzyme required for sulfatase activity